MAKRDTEARARQEWNHVSHHRQQEHDRRVADEAGSKHLEEHEEKKVMRGERKFGEEQK